MPDRITKMITDKLYGSDEEALEEERMDDMTRAEIRLDNAEAAIRELQSQVYALEQELLRYEDRDDL